MPFQLDLSEKSPRPLRVTHDDSGSVFRFEFHRIFTRAQRMHLTKTVGKGFNEKQVTDLPRIFREGVKSIQIDETDTITDAKTIVDALVTPENMGELPETVVTAVTSYLLGENVLQEEQGNS